jgi:hypothetical protein
VNPSRAPDTVTAHSPQTTFPICGHHRYAGRLGARPRVRILDLDSSRVHSRAALDAAIAAAAAPLPLEKTR